MITQQDFIKIIIDKENQNEIPVISNPLRIIAWETFMKQRNDNDFIHSSSSEDAIYNKELELADEIINNIAKLYEHQEP